MQTLQQELDPSPQGLTSQAHPVLRGLVADQAAAHEEEVRLLRQRVAVLESALASAKASPAEDLSEREAPLRASSGYTPPRHATTAASEFSASNAPAVVSVAEKSQQRAPVSSPPVSDPGFAQAWSEENEITFEERVAEKAFFQIESIDEPSREWLLKS